MANRNGVTVQAVIRALDILALFEQNSELSLADITQKMKLNKSTAYGLVNTLVIKDFLDQDEETKKYRLGIKNFELGNCVQNRIDIRREARPYMEKLAMKFKETIHLAKHHEGEIIYIDKIQGSDFSIVSSQIGHRAPMYCTGVGKVQLAYLPEKYLEDNILSKELHQYTQYTITDKEKLRQVLSKIREQGYGSDEEEIEIGLSCVAAPILGKNGKVLAGLSVSAPTVRMGEDKRNEILAELLEYAKIISRNMGYKPY